MSAIGHPRPSLPTSADFVEFYDFLYRTTGWRLRNVTKVSLERELRKHLVDLNVKTVSDYVEFVAQDSSGRELQYLVNFLATNETYFNRSFEQIEFLCRQLMDRIVEENPTDSSISIWSVPCSSGEEPYSIAIALLTLWVGIQDHVVEIHASDIDTGALDVAQQGVYLPSSLSRLDIRRRRRFFSRLDDGRFQICDRIRQAVKFSPLNVAASLPDWATRRFHVVICRNLLMYFDDASVGLVLENLKRSLRPGGYLLLGPADLLDISPALLATHGAGLERITIHGVQMIQLKRE